MNCIFKKVISCFVVMNVLVPSAFADDLYGKTSRVEVTIEGEYRSYRYCKKLGEGRGESCKDLGLARGYTLKELKKIASSERTEAILKAAGSVVFVVAIMASVFGSSNDSGEPTPVVGTIAGITLPTWFKRWNPFHQFKQANVLSRELLEDIDKEMNDRDIKRVAALLEEILDQILVARP